MRYLKPTPWHAIAVGTVVLDERGTPRTVVGNMEAGAGRRVVFLEGDRTPHYVGALAPVSPVEFDAIDRAVEVLQRAGLTVTPIKE